MDYEFYIEKLVSIQENINYWERNLSRKYRGYSIKQDFKSMQLELLSLFDDKRRVLSDIYFTCRGLYWSHIVDEILAEVNHRIDKREW